MIKVGITGGIGSGKSTVCKVFETLGVPVYYADEKAKNITQNNTAVKQAIIDAFGKEIINKDGIIERPKLAALVFNDENQLQKLNNIVHPAVAKDFNNWLEKHGKYPYILKEAAILFESGAYQQVDKIITVVAPIELRINRTVKRDNTSPELIKQRIANQMSDKEKIKRAHFVIHNDEQHLIIPQVIHIHKQLLNL